MDRSIKRIALIVAALLALVALFCLTGCKPNNYTSKKKDKVTELYRADAENWFTRNRPGAKVESLGAYTASTDLYAAVKGTYSYQGKQYAYAYDGYNKKMYSSESYEEVCTILKERMHEEFNLDPAQTTYLFLGYAFGTKTENDDWQHHVKPDPASAGTKNGGYPEKLTTPRTNMLPAELGAAEFAALVLAGKEKFTFAINSYVDAYPAYDQDKLKQYSSCLRGIWYYVPVYAGFNGAYKKVYRDNGVVEHWCHLQEFGPRIWAGWYFQGVPKFKDNLCVTGTEEDFTLTIPERTQVVLLTQDKLQVQNYFTSKDGKYHEFPPDTFYREECPGNAAYYVYGNDFVAPRKMEYGYKVLRNYNAKGVYRFKKK